MHGNKQLVGLLALMAGFTCHVSYAQSLPELPSLPPTSAQQLPLVNLPPQTGAALPDSPAQLPPLADEQSLPALPDKQQVMPPVTEGVPAANATENPPAVGAAAEAIPPDQAGVPPKEFSYGKSNLSILFLPSQMLRMKEAIRTYESTNKEEKPATFVAPEPIIKKVEAKINEPESYPVFYLASIAYEQPGDWSIWISGHKITSRKNETDVSILGVSREGVTFMWQPDYATAILRRKQDNAFAAIAPVKHKLAASQPLSINESGAVTFTLRPNQSFAVGYLSVFEGYVDSPKLQPIMTESSSSIDMSILPSGIMSGLSQPTSTPVNVTPPSMQMAPSAPSAAQPPGMNPAASPVMPPGVPMANPPMP